MTARSRLLGGINSPSTALTPSRDTSPAIEALDSDLVVILASLLCAVICILGLVAVTRCTWIRRIIGRDSAPLPSAAANRGLKKKVLKSLPKVIYSEDNEQVSKLCDCAICLAEFVPDEELRVLPQCGHGFHVVCIDTWLRSHSSCPSCRQIFEVARCKKCGRLPAASCSAAGLQSERRESHNNRFNP